MIQTLKQRRRQNFTRKQKGGSLIDFKLIDILKTNINISEKVQDFFSRINPFTRKKPFPKKVNDNVVSSVKTVAAAPKKVIAGVTKVKNMVGTSNSKGPFGGTRKRKQRKQRKH